MTEDGTTAPKFDEPLAVLDGELTEQQLFILASGVSSPDETFPEHVTYNDDLSPGRFATLCGFHDRVRETHVTVEETRATADALVLEYSTEATTADERGSDISTLAGRYTAMFAEEAAELWTGGPLPTLHARGHAPEETLSWRLEWAWAEAHVAGELSDDALLDRVIETVEVI